MKRKRKFDPWRCFDCQWEWDCYMVKDRLWAQIYMPDSGYLCLRCLRQRVRRILHRDLCIADFKKRVPVNESIFLGYELK